MKVMAKAKKDYPMKHLQVTADVHEAVNMMKRRYGAEKLHEAIRDFIEDKDPELLTQAQAIVDMRLGLDGSTPAPLVSEGDKKRRNTKS
jgi:hypothetical protein